MLSSQELWKATPASLANRLSKGKWKPARHLLAIDDAILDAVYGVHPRTIIEVPVRHGKSQICSVNTPAWFLEHWPDRYVALASYGAQLAQGFSRQARHLIEANTGFLKVRTDKTSRAVDRWHTTEGGGMMAVGVGGALTGFGADLLIVDDPIKNAEEAESETVRDSIWEWWKSVAYTRLEPNAAAIVIMARWHENDLVGRLLAQAAEPWRVVRLPALAEENDPLGRLPGEALWPERRTAAQLQNIKNAIGSYYFNALFQQRPSPPEGSILMRGWWRYWTELPRTFDIAIISWDMSFSDKGDDPSYVVGQVWGKANGNFYLIDQVRGQWGFPTTRKQVRALAARYPQIMHHLVEDKANGPAIIAELRNEIAGIIPVTPLGSKIARARAAAGPLEAGNVYIPAPGLYPWVTDFVEEAATFPNGTHDDQVDSFSQAVIRLNGAPVYTADEYADTRAA